MKVQVLIDNIAGTCGSRKLFGEWGLSVYVEFEDKRYLLDTGASHLFAKNAGVMGVDLSKVDMGVLSHAHFDHSDGMAEFFALNKTAPFYLRKGAGENCYHAHKLIGRFTYHEYIGIHKGFLKRFADRIRFAEGDMQIASNVYLVPHKTPGLSAIGERAHLSVKENGKYRYDSFDHEQSLVFDTPRGLFVMNSCSHGGADNIVKEIEATFPAKKSTRFSAGSTCSATRTRWCVPLRSACASSMSRKSTPGTALVTVRSRSCARSWTTAPSRCLPE
jgi:7,8-dihydropterin-6-yl-methyl-4-(beta-D-ribofuranosyl)aminobenzene 5'-phosphate synthase